MHDYHAFCLGFGLLAGGIYARRSTPASKAVENVDQPWLQRDDWAGGRITPRLGGKAAIAEFTELRWITIQSGHRHYPF